MEFAILKDIDEIVNLYKNVIDTVNKTDIKLGWNIDIYPDRTFVENAINKHEMIVVRASNKISNKIIAACVVNHTVNEEYDLIDWKVKTSKEKVATIHALATSPLYRQGQVSDRLLKDIEDYCRAEGDETIHLDVIDTNIPAYKLYLRNGYEERACIKMFYEVVGTREFWMLERTLV